MHRRNKLFVFIIITIISLYLINNFTPKRIKSGNSLKFFVTTDIHYLANSLTDDSDEFKKFAIPKDGKQLLYIEEVMDAFIDDIKSEKPDFLVISGDLTNNGEKESHLELANKLASIEKMGVKVFVTPGNHDTKNMWARGFVNGKQIPVESVNQDEFKEIYKNYGYKEAILNDNTSLSYMAAPSEDLWLLMLDSNLYFDGDGMPTNSGFITQDTMEWIRECSKLAKEKNAEIITVMHHNILKHNEKMSKGNTLDNSSDLVLLYEELGLNLVLSGHIHIQNIAVDENAEITEIVTSALSVYPQQYGTINYSKSKGIDYGTNKINVERWAKNQGLKDENLINFSFYSKSTFFERPYKSSYVNLEEIGEYSEEQIHEMSQILGTLNLAYFEGNTFNIRDEIKALPAYKLILETKSDYVYDFVYSMIFSSERDNTNIHIPIK